jgi:thioesterase DpgC
MRLDALDAFARETEERISALPEPVRRTPAQAMIARELKTALRVSRLKFLEGNADAVYDAVTDGRRVPMFLTELVAAAAARFPGVLPGNAMMDADRDRIQAEKEGWEIDQGLFVRAILRSPTSGTHLLESMLRPTARAERLLPVFRSTDAVDLGSVRLRRDGPIAELIMCRDDCLNAEDNRQVDDMETAVDLALLDDRVRVGVLRGGTMTHHRYAGHRVFSSGINLKALHAGRISFLDFLMRREMGYLSKLLRGVSVETTSWWWPRVEKPWVAAVDTFAIGGGAQLLLLFDRVIATKDAYFSLPAAREGIVPGASNLRLTRAIGARPARQIVLWGRRVHAGEPASSMLFDEVVDPDAMETAVADAAAKLDNTAIVANRRMLNLAEEPLDAFRTYMAEFALQQALRLYSEDVIGKAGRFAASAR